MFLSLRFGNEFDVCYMDTLDGEAKA